MPREATGPNQKALAINLDPETFGVFAEIGAGQEVARWFFRVGGAAGSIAKTMSAYDMTVSDAIYGKSDRYVSRQRLQTMVEHEYELLRERLQGKRSSPTRFFAFADTVTAKSYSRKGESHGWMGVRFQAVPEGEPSDVLIHVRMLDPENLLQQEAIGVVGVNLIHGALYEHRDATGVIAGLADGIDARRVEIDMVKFSGPAFRGVDNRLMSLQLVAQGLAGAAMFTANGEVVQASEIIFNRPILVERGSFRPVTHVNVDMLRAALAHFIQEPGVRAEDVVVLMEMTLGNLADGGQIDHRDFLDRVDTLGTLGQTVLVSSYMEFHRLASYLHRYTKQMVGVALGVPTLREIFDERYYENLDGGILESFGRLFKNQLKLYVYPWREPATGALVTAGNMRVAPHLRHLYQYLVENHLIQGLRDITEAYLPILSREVLARIRAGEADWDGMVPPEVANLIRSRGLFQIA